MIVHSYAQFAKYDVAVPWKDLTYSRCVRGLRQRLVRWLRARGLINTTFLARESPAFDGKKAEPDRKLYVLQRETLDAIMAALQDLSKRQENRVWAGDLLVCAARFKPEETRNLIQQLIFAGKKTYVTPA